MVRRTFVTSALVMGSLCTWLTATAFAQNFSPDAPEARVKLSATLMTPVTFEPVVTVAAAEPAPDVTMPVEAAPVPQMLPLRDVPPSRGSVLSHSLVGLYATTAVMQALDVRSTLQVVARGGTEANPLMAGLVHHKSAFIAVKAGIAAASIMAARQIAKRNKVAAIISLVAINSVYAAVVSHNFHVANALR